MCDDSKCGDWQGAPGYKSDLCGCWKDIIVPRETYCRSGYVKKDGFCYQE
jgi:hypothetical protein